VKDCPGSEALWLMAAKQKWLSRDVNAARQLLSNAFTHVENKEAVSLVRFHSHTINFSFY
jgi:pre-mRNA-processing factor 6